MNAPLLEAVRALHAARGTFADQTQQLAEARAAFDVAHAPLIRNVADAKAAVTSADTVVRTLAEAAYDASGSTKPIAGVTIVLSNTMDYNLEVALAWAKEKQMALVPESLDVTAFGKIAKATPLPFVSYGKIAAVRIASDLSDVLSDEQESVAAPTQAVTGEEEPF